LYNNFPTCDHGVPAYSEEFTEVETLKGMVNDTTAHAQKCDIRVTIIIVFGWIFCCTSGETQKINYLSKNIPFL